VTRRFPQVRTLRSASEFLGRLDALGVALPFDEVVAPHGAFAQPLDTGVGVAANRFAILPMEGWDATEDGRPTDLVRRRWRRFGGSGAGMVWGGEAVAVRPDGRANPRQLVVSEELAELRALLPAGTVAGLQLTHSGRWARPTGPPRPRVAYRNPWLDPRVGIEDDAAVLSDGELDDLAACYVDAAVVAQRAGFDFVDVKHCHGYLLHELLSARTRPGRYGGTLAHRTRFLTDVVAGVRETAPTLGIGIRLSAFDVAPFADGAPETTEYPYAFGDDGTGTRIDLTETHALLRMCARLGIRLVCITAGSPYYCPHVQRPAYFPPSDGYPPPRDPLVDVAQLLSVTAQLKRAHPELVFVGSGYSYLQEWLPNVAQAAVANDAVDSVGIGRLALSYPELPGDVLAGRARDRSRLCRTFSDCTTAPRNGVVSGCYPLDPFYKAMPERAVVVKAKRA
jgi:2,4-dienoyl-CoA reductase-like NADH-dependent reductase (Old Yellow Enzyme family)